MNKDDIDVGLSILCLHAKQGQYLSSKDIAEVCNCSRQNIDSITSYAMRKIRANPKNRSLKEYLNE